MDLKIHQLIRASILIVILVFTHREFDIQIPSRKLVVKITTNTKNDIEFSWESIPLRSNFCCCWKYYKMLAVNSWNFEQINTVLDLWIDLRNYSSLRWNDSFFLIECRQTRPFIKNLQDICLTGIISITFTAFYLFY